MTPLGWMPGAVASSAPPLRATAHSDHSVALTVRKQENILRKEKDQEETYKAKLTVGSR